MKKTTALRATLAIGGLALGLSLILMGANSQSVKIYANGGTQVVATSLGSFFLLECSGHYVDVP